MNNRGKRLISLVLNQNNERLNNADKELSGITHRRKSQDKVLDQNNEKLNNADKENQLSSILSRDTFSLIVLNGDNCHTENIEKYDQPQNIETVIDKSNLIQAEDLLPKTIQDDITQVTSPLDTLNALNIKANALAATDLEFTPYPWTVTIDDSTDTVTATNSTVMLTNCTPISTACTAAATAFATTSTSPNVTNSSRAACNNSTQNAENEPNPEQNLFYHVLSPLDTLNALNIEANALEATDLANHSQ